MSEMVALVPPEAKAALRRLIAERDRLRDALKAIAYNDDNDLRSYARFAIRTALDALVVLDPLDPAPSSEKEGGA